MNLTKKNISSVKQKNTLTEFSLCRLSVVLRISLLSSAVSVPGAFAVDLPSAEAGCADGLTTCNVTGAMGTDFTVTSNINAPGNGISASDTVTGTPFTVNSGISVTGGAGSSGFAFGTGSNNSLTNNGTIRGGLHGLYNFGTGFILTNSATGIISAPFVAIEGRTGTGGITINNSGTISPDNGAGGVAIRLYGDNNIINLNSSSNILGDIQLDPGQTNNQINLLDGTSTKGVFSNYVNTNSINVLNMNAPGTEWDMTGTFSVVGSINLLAGDMVVTGALSRSGTGSATIAAGTSLQVGNGGAAGSFISPLINNNGTLLFNRSDNFNFTSPIGGTGVVIQKGSGTTNLNGGGFWSGGTQVISGVLNGQVSNSLGTGNISVTNGAILQLGDISTTPDYSFSANALSLDASTLRLTGTQTTPLATGSWHFDNLITPISLSNSTLDFEQNAGASLHFLADVDALNTSALNYNAVNGDHTLAMDGSFTGSGNFTINMQETAPGSMNLAFNGIANNYTGSIVLSGDSYTVDLNSLLGQAAWDLTGSQTLNFNGANTHVITALVANAGSHVNITDANTELQIGSGTVGGIIGGAGSLTKTSTAILSLNGVNTYTGATKIQSGTVNLGVANAIATSSAVDVASGATLDINGFNQTVQNLTGDGSILLGAGNLTAQNASDTAFSGPITGTGSLIKTGNGVLSLSSTSSSVGATQVSEGTLLFTQSGAFNAASLLVDSGATAQFDASSQLTATGNATVNGILNVTLGGVTPMITAADATLGATSVLTVNGFAPITATKASDLNGASSVIIQTTNGISGDFSLVDGISASNVDYVTSGGHLSADGKNYSVGSVLTWLAGPTLGNGNFTLTNAGDAFNVDVALGNQGASTTGWDGTTLTKLGAGNLTLSAANTYTGATNVQAGTLTAGIANAFSASSAVTVASGATLALNSLNQLAQDLSGAGIITLGSGTLAAQNNNNTAFSGTINGTGGLTKTGSGALTLSATGSSVGATEISAGTLHFAQSGMFNAASLLVDSGATAQLDANAQVTASGSATVNGILDVTLGGTAPILTAANATLNTSSSTLNISGFSSGPIAKASDLDGTRTVVIHTTGGITGDFSAVQGVGQEARTTSLPTPKNRPMTWITASAAA